MFIKTISNEFKEFNEKERTITHYISTPQVDAYNEVLIPDGMDDSRFKAVLWGHSLGSNWLSDSVPPPSELVIGKSLWRKRSEDGVKAKTQFADTPLGNDVMYFNQAGLINSWSVGWQPKGDKTFDEKTRVTTYPKWYLYEYSSVIIPANSGAVNLMLQETKSLHLKNILTYQQNYLSMEEQLKGFKLETDKIKTLQDEIELLKNKPEPETDNSKKIIELEAEIQDLNERLTLSLKRNAEYRRHFISGAFEPRKLDPRDVNDMALNAMYKVMGLKPKK